MVIKISLQPYAFSLQLHPVYLNLAIRAFRIFHQIPFNKKAEPFYNQLFAVITVCGFTRVSGDIPGIDISTEKEKKGTDLF